MDPRGRELLSKEKVRLTKKKPGHSGIRGRLLRYFMSEASEEKILFLGAYVFLRYGLHGEKRHRFFGGKGKLFGDFLLGGGLQAIRAPWRSSHLKN